VNALAGTGALTRLALRLDRVRLIVWVLILGGMPYATAAQYKQLYPTEDALQAVSGVVSNPSLVAMNGPMFGVSLGGLTTWKTGATELILIALMSLFTVVRHSRAEEEAGRLELIGSGVLGRYAPLSAALVTVVMVDAVTAVLVALGLLAAGLPAAGSIAFGLVVGLTGVLFAAVAAVAAQLFESARAANGAAAAVLAVAYLLRAIGDTGPTWLTWASPLGWGMRMRPFDNVRWWVPALVLVLAVVLAAIAYTLAGRRDLGAGLLPQRPAPAAAGPHLNGAFGLAWRLHRGNLIGWTIGMAAGGGAMGGAAKGIQNAFNVNQKVADMLSRLGGSKALADAYLAAVFGIVGLVVAAYPVQVSLRLRAEESAGRVEPLLATPVGRLRWAASHLVFALLGTALLLAVAGLAAGLAYGVQAHDTGHQVGRLLAAAMVQLPAAWVLAGLAVALFGLVPRLTSLSWAALIVCLLVLDLGALLGLSQWVLDVSPFAHLPKLPGVFSATPLVWLTGVAVVLGAAGLAGFRRRDIG
jgi:ABC-2 type transport system permease protein